MAKKNGRRNGIPPMYYPTHSTGFYTCVTRKRFVETTCAHGGSHGYLTDDFLRAILDPKHRHVVNEKVALDTTICGVYSHLSAMRGGETLKIPAVC